MSGLERTVPFRRFRLLAVAFVAFSACTDREPTGPSSSDLTLAAAQGGPGASLVKAIDLGTLGGTYARAYAINNSSQIVGVSRPAAGPQRATYWEKISQTAWSIHQLSAAPGETQSGAAGINDRGVIAGWTYSVGNDGDPVRWLSPASAPQNLGAFGMEAGGINFAGQIVGTKPVPATAEFEWTTHGFLWDNGVVTDLGDLGGRQSQAFRINSAGDIVGYSRIIPFPNGRTRAVVWKAGVWKADGITVLPMLPGGTGDAMARNINDAGVIVGQSPTASGEAHAVRWVPAAGEPSGYRIDDLGLGRSVASGINTHGEIVGEYYSRGSWKAFFWHPLRGKTDLPALRKGANAQAHGINDAREVIGSGQYQSNSSDLRAIVWVGVQ